MVIKTNLEQRYATSAVSGFFFRACGAKADLPFQEYAVPAVRRLLAPLQAAPLAFWPCGQDCPCGSTFGPILSAATGIRCVDVGPAQWSMHSVRETMGAHDVQHTVDHFKTVFEHFPGVDSELTVDGVPYNVGNFSCGESGDSPVKPSPVARSLF